MENRIIFHIYYAILAINYKLRERRIYFYMRKMQEYRSSRTIKNKKNPYYVKENFFEDALQYLNANSQ